MRDSFNMKIIGIIRKGGGRLVIRVVSKTEEMGSDVSLCSHSCCKGMVQVKTCLNTDGLGSCSPIC